MNFFKNNNNKLFKNNKNIKKQKILKYIKKN